MKKTDKRNKQITKSQKSFYNSMLKKYYFTVGNLCIRKDMFNIESYT